MFKCLILSLLAVFTLAVMSPDADARRMGGGFSFGKQRMQPATPHYSQQRSTPGGMAAPTRQRGTARTGMMGMLGGLALGGLLGAMFFGGAFNGINILDILVIGGIIFLVMRFLRRRAGPDISWAGHAQQMPAGHHAGFGDQSSARVSMLRPNIDERHFIKAARDIFMRLQAAWDAQDTADIRRFCTAEMADKIASDMRQDLRNRTEVTALDARISDSWMESDLEWVAVQFNAMLHEQQFDSAGNMLEDSNNDVVESWIFRHDPNSEDPTWYLAGIQQH